MKRLHSLITTFGVGALAVLGLASCGDNGVECGDKTHAENGQCVPDATCGTGTILVGDTCLPDGSVVCEQGTVFDVPSGTCVVDPSACADGTTLVGSECVPDDELLEGMADHTEGAEPNGPADPNVAGMFDTPALNASTTFYGCITATDDADGDGNLDADLDTWLVTADAPMVLEITTDGIRGLSAGFIAVNADQALSPVLDNWQRIGINLTGDTAKREIFLPAAGVYALFVTDARSLFLGQAGAGTDDTCYFATVKHVANPTPVAVTIPQTSGQDRGQVRFYNFTAAATGNIIDVTENSTAPALSPAFVTLRGGVLQGSSTTVAGAFGNTPPFNTVGGLNSGEVITFVADAEYNFGLTPQDYDFDFFDIHGQALPTTGSPVLTVPEQNGASGAGYPDLNYLYFDVANAGIKHFNVVSSKPIDMAIVRRDIFTPAGAFDYVAQIDAFGGAGRTTFQGEFVRFLTPGRYYFVTQNPAATTAGGNYTITATLTDMTTSALTLGTGVTAQTLTQGNRFHTIDLTDPIWLEFGVTATTNWGTGSNVSIEAYDLAAGGWLRSGTAPATIPPGNLYPAFTGTQPSVAPFAPMGRIMARETRDFVLRVKPTGTPAADPTYSLLVRNRPNVTNLNVVMPGTPITQTVPALAATGPARFIAFGAPGNNLRALAHPTTTTVDIQQRRVNANESTAATFNATLLGGDETLNGQFGAQPNDWVAWTVENNTPVITSDVQMTISAIAPRPYTITTGTLAFSDACTGTGSSTLGTGLDDEIRTAQTLPFAFQLFGEDVPATFRVGANGWLSWDAGTVSFGAYQNRQIPTAGPPDGVLAPFWQDLDTVTLCRKDTANTVTYQWTGNVYQTPGQPVQFQVVIHQGGVIDFIYGAGQTSNGGFVDTDGNGATVGAENLSGTFGHQIAYNQPTILPGTSRTLTPM